MCRKWTLKKRSTTEEIDPTPTLTSTSRGQERTLDYHCHQAGISQPNTYHHSSTKERSMKLGHLSLPGSDEPPSQIYIHSVRGGHVAAWTSVLSHSVFLLEGCQESHSTEEGLLPLPRRSEVTPPVAVVSAVAREGAIRRCFPEDISEDTVGSWQTHFCPVSRNTWPCVKGARAEEPGNKEGASLLPLESEKAIIKYRLK